MTEAIGNADLPELDPALEALAQESEASFGDDLIDTQIIEPAVALEALAQQLGAGFEDDWIDTQIIEPAVIDNADDYNEAYPAMEEEPSNPLDAEATGVESDQPVPEDQAPNDQPVQEAQLAPVEIPLQFDFSKDVLTDEEMGQALSELINRHQPDQASAVPETFTPESPPEAPVADLLPPQIAEEIEENQNNPPPPPQFVGAAGQREQRRKNKYICVGSRSRVDHTAHRIGRKGDNWVDLGYNAFNAQDYWRQMERWKAREEGVRKPKLPKLYYLSMVDGRVRRNDLTEGQKQRCLGLMPPCPPGQACPGELGSERRRESTLQGKRRIPISDEFRDRILEGQVSEPPRIVGCIEADDDLGGRSRGDAAPFRNFQPSRDPVTKKLRPIPPPDYPIDVCEPAKFAQWLQNDDVHPDKPIPGRTIPQTIVDRDNKNFSNQPFEVSLFYAILFMTQLLDKDPVVNARFIQKLMNINLPPPYPRSIRQLYINPEDDYLVLPANQANLRVDFTKGKEFWFNRELIDAYSREFNAEVAPQAGDQFHWMMRASFGTPGQGGKTDLIIQKLQQFLQRPSGALQPIPLVRPAVVAQRAEQFVSPPPSPQQQPPETPQQPPASPPPPESPEIPSTPEVPSTPELPSSPESPVGELASPGSSSQLEGEEEDENEVQSELEKEKPKEGGDLSGIFEAPGTPQLPEPVEFAEAVFPEGSLLGPVGGLGDVFVEPGALPQVESLGPAAFPEGSLLGPVGDLEGIVGEPGALPTVTEIPI